MERLPRLRRAIAMIAVVVPLFAVAALPAAGLDRAQFEQARDAWMANRDALDSTTDSLEAVDEQAQDVAAQIEQVEARLQGARARLDRLAERLRAARQQERRADGANDVAIMRLGQETRALTSMEESLALYLDELEVQVVAAYKYGGTSAQFRGIVDVLLSSGSLSEFTAAYEKLQASTVDQGNLVDSVAALARELVEQRAVVEILQRKTQKAELEASEHREYVAELTASQEQLVADMRADRRKRRGLLEQLHEEQAAYTKRMARLQKQSEALFEQLRDYRYVGGAPGSQDMLWPTDGTITSGFGYRKHPILKRRRLHAGIDIPAPTGQDIYAVAAGTVVSAGGRGGYGNVVVLDHGEGITTVYAHQSRITVSAGDEVRAGDEIGEVGSTGLSTGPHLHFEVRLYGRPVNPLDWY